MKKYKVVRTYDDGECCEKELQQAFDEGWQFLRASEYVPERIGDGEIRYGYIEYILMRDMQENSND